MSYGTPIWVDAELPIESEKPDTKFQHLMIAQDTGSAIVGPARADIYFGHGEDIGHIAGRIKQYGQFVMLVPRSIEVKSTIDTPLPKPRPKDIVAAARRDKRPAMSRDGKRRRGLSYEDRVLWTHVTKAITPLRTEAPSPADDSADDAPEVAAKPAKHPPKFSKPVKQRQARYRAVAAEAAGTIPRTADAAHEAARRARQAADRRPARPARLHASRGACGVAAFLAQRAMRATRGWCW